MHRLYRAQAARAVRLFGAVIAGFLLSLLGACGGHTSTPISPFPGKITLSPSTDETVQLGGTLFFVASAENATGTNIAATFVYQSSDTTILNLAPNGVACAGTWDAAFVTCTPGNYGTVQVTATALGASSLPTLVYVHPPIDNIQITVVPPVNTTAPACPGPQTIPLACIPPSSLAPVSCLSANQSMTLQANAFSKGVDVTASVGPFNWTETSATVVAVTPVITNTNTNSPTNQAVVTPGAPGFTPVFASASNVSSQPYYAETCPVQCVALDLGSIGSGQTAFATSKGISESVLATAVDVQGCVVPKPNLTWSSSQPAAVLAGDAASGCAPGATCAVSTPQPGAGSITAACLPPTCNVGFPQSVVGLPQTLVQPLPVFPLTAISGLVTGTPGTTNVLATSLDCAVNFYCNANIYDVSTSTNVSGSPTQLPAPPDSLMFDLLGDKAYMGGNYGSVVINPSNFGTANTPFTDLGSVTGAILATSATGNFGIFSDTLHTPNHVFVVNTSVAASPTVATLNISGATAAAFSPDGLKAFIVGPAGPSCNLSAPACLYVYSQVQALQTLPLTAAATGITFSSTGAFAFLTGGSAASTVTAFNTCDNNLSTDSGGAPLIITLAAPPLFLKTLPPGVAPPQLASSGLNPAVNPTGLDVLVGLDNTGLDLIATNASPPPGISMCPQTIALAANPATSQTFTPLHINLGQGNFNPIDFFLSPDASTVYIVASDRSDILVFNFNTNSTAGIPLASTSGGSVSPVTASMTVDGSLLYVTGTDGELHEVSTSLRTDLTQIGFPNLPDVTNPFCTSGDNTVPCNLNVAVVKP
jgi:hypothetical protein